MKTTEERAKHLFYKRKNHLRECLALPKSFIGTPEKLEKVIAGDTAIAGKPEISIILNSEFDHLEDGRVVVTTNGDKLKMHEGVYENPVYEII